VTEEMTADSVDDVNTIDDGFDEHDDDGSGVTLLRPKAPPTVAARAMTTNSADAPAPA